MKEIYKTVYPGWLYQTNITSDIMKYDVNYVNTYNSPSYSKSKEMNELRFSLVSTYTNARTIMDVGYGNGDFLNECVKNNLICSGYDISDYPLPKNVRKATNIFESNDCIDCITFFDSIEHFTEINLHEILKQLNVRWLIISAPWCHWIDDMIGFEKWKHRKPNEHFHHFDMRGLITLAELGGFNVIHASNIEDKIRVSVTGKPNIATIVAVNNK